MRIYVWEDPTGGYGHSGIAVLASDEGQARLIAEAYAQRLDEQGSAKTEAWIRRKERSAFRDWQETEEGKAWAAMPDGGLVTDVSGSPTRVVDTDVPAVVMSIWYYE